jgi:hypothetical protein
VIGRHDEQEEIGSDSLLFGCESGAHSVRWIVCVCRCVFGICVADVNVETPVVAVVMTVAMGSRCVVLGKKKVSFVR